jgi:iron complex outermembrane receptor protein
MKATVYIIEVVLLVMVSVANAGELDEIGKPDKVDEVDSASAADEDELMDEFALLEEEDIVYSAAKHKQEISESPSAVTVITREQIENTHCADVICLMRMVPEVDVLRMSPGQSSVGTRALTNDMANKGLVLVDGREINLEILGLPMWQILRVHLEDIERIEILRGPASALYGANAHSMVVSIITRRTSNSRAEVFLGTGEHDRNSLHLRLDQRLGDFLLHFSGGVDTQGHWRIRDWREREFERFRLRVDYEGDSSLSTLDLGMILVGASSMFTFLAPGNMHDAIVGEFLAVHKTDWLKAQVSLVLIDGKLAMDMPLEFEGIKLGTWPQDLDIFTSTMDTEIQLNWEPEKGHLFIVGGNYRWITMISDNNYPKENHQHRIGVYLHNEQKLGDYMILTTGVRLDYNNISPFTVSPRVAGIYKFSDTQSARLAFGQAFLKPSFYNTSLHVDGVKGEPGYMEIEDFFRENLGSEKVGNESITSFEAGYSGRFFDGQLAVESTAFYNRYRDFIFFNAEIATNSMGLPDLEASVMEFVNTGLQVDTLGGSLSVTYRMKNILRANANYTFRYSWYVSDNPVDTYTVGNVQKGDRIPWEPAHLANLAFQYFPSSGLRAGVSLHWHSSCEMAMPENGGAFDDKVMLPRPAAYFVSGFVAWKESFGANWIEMGVRALNIFNAGFREFVAVTRPDGVELGGELLSRRILFFFRGSI